MKRIALLATIISNLHCLEPVYISNIESLKELVKPNETLWFIAPLKDSFENEIIQEMVQDSRFQKLQQWHPLSFEEYRSVVLSLGLSIIRTEVQRDVPHLPLAKWVKQEIAPQLGLDPDEEQLFADEFVSRFGQPFGIYRRLLMEVE